MILTGDSLDILKTLDENSVDSIVTDPPYGLSFMGKKWDYDVPSSELWKEALRVLKPGGHLLAFAGTRTQHRMAVNIEDAGFEIRDMIAWVYGSGFPKSLNIGKAVDKLQGNEREVTGSETIDVGMQSGSMHAGRSSKLVERSVTKGNSPYEGWGTALKPALEPITVARKPFKGSVAQNVLKYGTGGVNIDGCRVELNGEKQPTGSGNKSNGNTGIDFHGGNKEENNETSSLGRFPANLIHDGSDEVVGLFPETKSGGGNKNSKNSKAFFGNMESKEEYDSNFVADSGSASRFFYCAKSSKSERNKGLDGFEEKSYAKQALHTPKEGSIAKYGYEEAVKKLAENSTNKNNHPTVKPVKLMQYLVRLVTPKGGTVLDPFNGSGTTGIACKLEGMEYIGIELDPEYVKISEARIEAWQPEEELQMALV